MNPIAQLRSSQDSDDWREAPWLDPQSIGSTNAIYGWEKFRLSPDESENAA